MKKIKKDIKDPYQPNNTVESEWELFRTVIEAERTCYAIYRVTAGAAVDYRKVELSESTIEKIEKLVEKDLPS